MFQIFAFTLILTLCGISEGGRILLAVQSQGRSHILTAMPLAKRLIADGHEVTAFFEIAKPELPLGGGLKEELVQLEGMVPIDEEPGFIDLVWNQDMAPIGMLFGWFNSAKASRILMQTRPEKLRHLTNQHWNLVIVDDLFTTSGLALTKLIDAPHTVLDTSSILPMIAHCRALFRTSPTGPALFVTHDEPPFSIHHFGDRLTSASKNFFQFVSMQMLVGKHMVRWGVAPMLPNSDFDWCDYYGSAGLSTFDFPETLDYPRAKSQELISVGTTCNAYKSLPKDIEAFVNDPNSKGTIWIALGTMVRWDKAPEHKRQAMVDALKRMKEFRVLWSYPYGQDQLDLPPHIKLVNWLPQADVLHHEKTRVFVSHMGLKSFKEAICAEVPVVAMPMMYEQIYISTIARKLGIAEYLNKQNLTADYIENIIRQIADDTRYSENVRKAKSSWVDRVIPSLDEGAFWIGKLMRNGRLPEFFYKRRAEKSYFFAYLGLDLMCLVLLVSACLAF